jgi:hypothetical protein
VPVAPHAWARFPGLRFGHTVGNRGGGRIQLAVRRDFTASPTDMLSTTQVFEYALIRRDRWRHRNRWSVVRLYVKLPTVLAALIRRVERGSGGSRRPLRIGHSRRWIEIVGGLATCSILPNCRPWLEL